MKRWISNLLGGSLIYIVTVLLVVAAVVSLIDFIFRPEVIRKNNYLRKAFSTTPLYLVSKVIGAVTGVMVLFQVGPEVVISADTGGSIIDLCGTLLCILVAFSFVLPFLTDCGIMEFLGVITRPVVRPLFHVPGRAAVDLIASWFGASNAAVILTREQYMKGFYTKREAGYIMTNFSLVSVPFCLMVAETIGRDAEFPVFYLSICVVGVILAVILVRIPPIFTIPNTYREAVGKQVAEDLPEEKGVLAYALESSCKRAEEFHVDTVLSSGMEVMMGMMFDLIPIVASWGVIALAIATYTPFFRLDFLSHGTVPAAFRRGGCVCGGSCDAGRIYGYVYPCAADDRNGSHGENIVYRRRSVPDTDYLSDRGRNRNYQKRGTSGILETAGDFPGENADCDSNTDPDCKSDLLIPLMERLTFQKQYCNLSKTSDRYSYNS